MFLYQAVDRYNKTSSISDRKRFGLSRNIRMKKAIKAVRERIQKNPVRKQNIVSREMKIGPKTVRVF